MPTRPSLRARCLALAAGVLLALGLTGALTPRAGAVQSYAYTHWTPTKECVMGIVALNEPAVGVSPGGYLRSIAQSLIYGSSTPCASPNLVPAGAIRVNQVLQKISGSNWVYCSGTQTGDYYNTSLAWNKMISSNYGSSPRCGPGAYRGMGRGWVNGLGGATVTTSILLP